MGKVLEINKRNIKAIKGNPQIVEVHIRRGGEVHIEGGAAIMMKLPSLRMKIERHERLQQSKKDVWSTKKRSRRKR